MMEAPLQEASRKKRAAKARKLREKIGRKEVALADESRANGPCKGSVDQLALSEAWEPMPYQKSVPPERTRMDAGTEKDSEPEEGCPICRPHSDEEQTQEAKAQVRRNRFSPKLLTVDEDLARLWRRERKLMYDEIRAERKQGKGGKSGPTAGNRETGGPVEAGAQRPRDSSRGPTLIQVYIRRKW
jgi:hypothetical protein